MKCAIIRIAWALVLGVLLNAHIAQATTHEVGSGESLYAIVATHYPQELNNWTSIAAQLAELNPEVLTQGLDTPLQPGMVLRLLDEADSSAPPPLFKEQASSRAEPGANNRQQINEADRGETRASDSGPKSHDTKPQASQANQQVTPPLASLSEPTRTKKAIGTVTELSGLVTLKRKNQSLQPIVGDEVFAGDEVRSTSRASLELMMLDQTLLRLASGTVVYLEDYVVEAESGKGQIVATLVQGVLQSDSGELATNSGNQLSINTVISTISAQDTEFALAMCSASSCDRPGLDINAGLYSGVIDGTITLLNNTGTRITAAGEFLHIASVNSEAENAPNVTTLLFNAEQLEQLSSVNRDEPLGFLGWLLSLIGFGDD